MLVRSDGRALAECTLFGPPERGVLRSVSPTDLIWRSTNLARIQPNCKLLNVFCRKNIAKLNKELQTKTLLQLSETDRLRQTEHQLHISESKVEKLNSDNIKLRLKIDDLRIKMQSRKYHIEENF